MRAVLADQSITTIRVAINDQLLAENINRFDRFLFGELRGGGYRMPISSQQLAARRAAAYLSQKFIFFACEHRIFRAAAVFLLFVEHLLVAEFLYHFQTGV